MQSQASVDSWPSRASIAEYLESQHHPFPNPENDQTGLQREV